MAEVSICLNMIVKDEAHVIEETLRMVCAQIPISRWVICDTGSTDGTQDTIRQTFADLGIEGELHQRPWVNFGHNRNEALQLCSKQTGFVFFFDADDQLFGFPDVSNLVQDAYNVRIASDTSPPSYYYRKLLLRNDGRARWRGVVHEYVDTADMTVGTLAGDYIVVSRRKGARSSDPEKYLKDARLLEAGFEDPADADIRPRYAYYCANSWRDYGDADRALDWYAKRVELDGWSEERFLSCLEAGLIHERKGNKAQAVHWFLRGHDIAPDRAECIYHASRVLRSQSLCRAAMILAKAGIAIPRPEGNRLFVNSATYDYWMAHEILMLVGLTGGNVAATQWYGPFMESKAPADAKAAVARFAQHAA